MTSTIMIASDNIDELSTMSTILHDSKYFKLLDTYEMKRFVHFVLEHQHQWELYDLGLMVQALKMKNNFAQRKEL